MLNPDPINEVISNEATDRFTRHRGPVTCAAEIPGTSTIITSAYDSAVALFERDTETVSLLGYHQHLANRVNINATGTLAASSSSDYNIYLWDLAERKLLKVLQGHDDDVEDFVFINERYGASASRDWRIIVWDLQTGGIHRVIRGHEKDVLSINYLDGKLYSSGDDMTLRSWDLQTGKPVSVWGPFETETDTSAIDALHGRAILGCDDGKIRVFDIHTGDAITTIDAHSSGIKKVAVSPITGDILSAAYDQRILIWDQHNFQLNKKLETRPALWERSFNWSPDGQRVVAGTFDGTVLVWDASSGQCMHELGADADNTHRGNACFNDIAAQGDEQIVVVSDDGRIRVGQLTEQQSKWTSSVVPGNDRVLMNAIGTDDDQQLIIAGTHDQNLHVFNTENGELQSEFGQSLQQGPINCVRSSPLQSHTGHLFAACYSGAVVHLSADRNEQKIFQVHENAVKALRLHPNKPVGVSCSADGSISSWDYQGNVLREYAGHTAIVDDVDIDPEGRWIASTGRDFTLKIHGMDDGVLYHSIELGRRSPKALCFVSSDVVVVTTYWGELIRVSLADGQIKRATISDNGISSITRLNGHLAAAGYDGAVYLVDSNDLSVRNTLRSMTQKVTTPAYV